MDLFKSLFPTSPEPTGTGTVLVYDNPSTINPAHQWTTPAAPSTNSGGWFDDVTGLIKKGGESALDILGIANKVDEAVNPDEPEEARTESPQAPQIVLAGHPVAKPILWGIGALAVGALAAAGIALARKGGK